MTQNNKNASSPYYLLYPLLLLLLLTVETYTIVHQTHTSHGASQHLQKITNTTPADMTLFVKIKLAGIGNDGNISPKHHVRKITTFVYGTASSPLAAATTLVTFNGTNYFTGIVHLGKLKQGQYLIKFFSDHMIQEGQTQMQTLLGDKTTVLPPIILYPGDLNADNVLGNADYRLMQSCLQNTNCLLADTIDFNDDGKTNITDYNLFLQNFAILHND